MQIVDRKIGEGFLIDGSRFVIALGMDFNQIRVGTGTLDFTLMESINLERDAKPISFLPVAVCRKILLMLEKYQNRIH